MSQSPSPVLLLARRFLLSKVSDHFISLIAWVSVVGVALGVLALTVVTSVINGFEGELVRVITGMNGDVVLYSRADPIRDPLAIERKIRKLVPSVQAITGSFVAELMASGPSGVAGAALEGFDPATLGQVTAIPRRLVSGRFPESGNEVALGYALADRLGAKEGTDLRLVVPFVGEGEGVGTPKVVQVRVVGIVRMGMYEYDSQFIFMPLPAVQAFLAEPGKVTSFNLRLAPGADSQAVSDRLTDNFGFPFRSKNWAQLNKNLFYAIKLEKVVIAIILTVIVLVAAFNVVSTLMMMIHDKTKEIAILKAMGLSPWQGFKLFWVIGLGMGLVGAIVGVGGGMGINWILAKTHWIELPPDIYYIGYLPVTIRWKEIGLITLVALLVSFMATLYPAMKVARRPPLEGLRYE